jgi:MFS family permease
MKAITEPAGSANAAPVDSVPTLDRFDSPRAWWMVGAAFVAMFAAYGVAYSFGAFFKPMAAEFGAPRSATSAIFSITVLVWCVLGPITGHLSDRFGPRVVVGTGALVMGLGLALTSMIDRLWIGYLTYGIGVGVGVACAYVPMVAVVGGWFIRRRNTALGIAVAGIGFGTVCGAPIAAALIAPLGWRATYIVFAIATSATLLGCAFVAERPPVHVTPSPIRLGDTLRTPAFAVLYASSLLVSTALFVPFVYLPSYAHDHGVSEFLSAALVGIVGGASVAGRMGLGALADRAGVVRLYQASFLVLALSYGIWMVASSYATMVLFALVMGAGYGGYVALSPAVIAHLFGTHRMGTMLGALYTSGGFGAMVGPPIVGLIIDRTGSYRLAIAAAFAVAMLAFALLIPLRRYEPASESPIAPESPAPRP